MSTEPALEAGPNISGGASGALVGDAITAGITGRRSVAFWLTILLHATAIALAITTEVSAFGFAIYLIVWIALNALWLAMVRRPAVAALISLEIFVLLILLSRFKFDKLWATLDFIDVMIVDHDTTAFLLATFPALRWWILLAVAAAMIAGIITWRLDRHHIRSFASLMAFGASGAALIVLSLSYPSGLNEDFEGKSYVSKFARTGVEAVHELMTRGYFEAADKMDGNSIEAAAPIDCHPTRRLPNIILLHDESSFDITAAAGSRVPPNYQRHFESFDGKARKLLVEGVGGPSWFAEFNVLTGLSVRSFGRFATSVTRIAAGHVFRGLPHSLRVCGYQTFSLYPFYGSFLGSRAFQTTTGIEYYLDMRDLGTTDFEADSFYYDRAIDLIHRERGDHPLFLYVYNVANHFPWNERLRPQLTPDWNDLGNAPDVNEYIRRQGMSAHDYQGFLAQLKRDFPREQFLIVRYGDHQPQFGARVLDPLLSKEDVAKQAEQLDLRYLTTYYAVDAVNFAPADMSSALVRLDAPYLPLVVLEAAGIPLDATFAMQRQILKDCKGLFYSCEGGARARQLNRLSIDAGLIKGL